MDGTWSLCEDNAQCNILDKVKITERSMHRWEDNNNSNMDRKKLRYEL
jgi:hypothetical protein